MMRTMWSRVRALFLRQRLDDVLEAEVRDHLESLTDDYVRRGLSPEQARLAARRAFGGVEPMKERYRDHRSLRWLEDLGRDIRYALRMLRRDRVVAAIAVVTLALGIGANTALFSVIDALMLKPMPVASPEKLRTFMIVRGGNQPGFSFSYPLYEDYQAKATAFSGLIAMGSVNPMRLAIGGGDGGTEVARTQGVSGNFFSVLSVGAAAGRTIVPADDDVTAPVAAAVLSDGFWARRFGRDPRVIGRRITINEVPFTIVGVAAGGFRGAQVGADPDIWWPNHFLPRLANAPPNLLLQRGNASWRIIGRLRPGVDHGQAATQANAIFQADLAEQLERRMSRPDVRLTPAQRRAFTEQSLRLESAAAGWTSLRWEFEQPLVVLMIVVALVLLVACANVANLLLARAAVRRREIAVRMALGSGRGRLVRQLMTESVALAGLGGTLGVGIGVLVSRMIPALMTDQDIALRVGLDLRVLSFAAVVSLGSALVFGVLPALTATRMNFATTLNEHSRGAGIGRRFVLHNAIVVAQIALSVVVLVGAGLFVRTLTNLLRLDTGFDRQNLTVFAMQIPARYDGARRTAVYQGVIDRLQQSPGSTASYSFFGLLSGNGWGDRFEIPGYTPQPDEPMQAQGMLVSPGFFETTGTRLMRGREFDRSDEQSAIRVAVVNQTMARRFGSEPLGRRFVIPASFPNETFEIVGVAEDAMYRRLRQEAQEILPAFYLPVSQAPGASIAARMRDAQVELRTPAAVAGVEAAIRAAVREVDPAVAVTEPRSMSALVDRTIAREHLLARLATWLGALALTLGAIGIYGVRSYTVNRRRSEIGLRLALGATTSHVFGLIVGQGVRVTAMGIAIGVIAAAALTRYVETLLFRVEPLDPITFGVVVSLFVTVAVLASYGPARRAARVDPAVTLRSE
jgi:predicted permease